jgi:hypothetical protein
MMTRAEMVKQDMQTSPYGLAIIPLMRTVGLAVK